MAPGEGARAATLIAALGTVLAGAYAVLAPAGQPYDEPAHWGNVLFYATEHRMPELGEVGTQYEAQMGPGYYTPAALVVQLVGTPGDRLSFEALRWAGVLLVPLLSWLTYRLALAVQGERAVAVTAVAAVALSPLLLAIGSSVQNDYLAIVLSAVALLVGVRVLQRDDAPWTSHLGLGVLVGLAILTKVVAISLVAALVLTYAIHPRFARRLRLLRAGTALTGVGLSSGWWFVRNLLVYGDLTGASRMEAIGYEWPVMRLGSVGVVVSWLSSVISYVFAPVEYHRNALDTPEGIRVAAGLMTLAVLGALLAFLVVQVRSRSLGTVLLRRPDRVLLVSAVLMSVVFYLSYAVLVWWIPARLAFLTAPAAAVLFAVATRGRMGTVVRVGTLGLYAVVNLWVLASLPGLAAQPFWIFPD
jgi:D-alanyl-D-alanine carboxypeptidase (penicillin-binding protein 5/6)